MTAEDYLEQLQRVNRRFDYLVEILLDRRDIMLGRELPANDDDAPRFAREIAASTFDDLFTELPEQTRAELESELASYLAGKSPELSWAQRTHNDFLTRASDDAKRIFRTLDLAVGELETASFNASAIPVPGQDCAWVIALNKGLSLLVYETARTVAGTYKVSLGEPTADLAESLTHREAARILYERLNCYLHLGVPYGDECHVSQHARIMASDVTTMAQRFAYLHEMSHIILGHINGAPLIALPDDWSAARHTTHASDQEHEADMLAWSLLARMFVRNVSDLQMAYAGASLLLSVSHILECANDVGAVGTHPPALRRKAYLHEVVKATLKEVGVPFEQASMIERAMSEGLDKVMAETPALPGECPFQAVLDRASSAVIPNYMLFQSEVMPLLSHSAPHRLCRAMGHALGRAEVALKRLGWFKDPQDESVRFGTAAVNAARKPFNDFKLIRGLMGLYLIPEISRFIEDHRKDYVEKHYG